MINGNVKESCHAQFGHLLGENGFLCVDVPEEYGGYGVPTHYSLMLVEESARAGY